MKKHLILAAMFLGMMTSVNAASQIDATVTPLKGCSDIKTQITITEAPHPVAVTVSVKDENGSLNYFDIVMTDDDGNVEFEYVNFGNSGDYVFNFAAQSLNLSKTVTISDLKGADFWTTFYDTVTDYAEANDAAGLQTFVMNNNDELELDTSEYVNLTDKLSVFEGMIKQCAEYANKKEVVKEYNRSVKLCVYNENKSSDLLKQYYNNYSELFGLDEEIPLDTDGTAIFNKLSVDIQNSVYNALAEKSFDKTDAFVDAFVYHTIAEAIENAEHYGTIKQVINSYSNAGLIAVDSCLDFDRLCKDLMGYEGSTDLNGIQTKINAQVQVVNTNYRQEQQNTNAGGGGGGGGGGAGTPVVNDVTEIPEPINPTQKENEYQSGAMYFSDIEDAKWALDAINLLHEKGIVSGVGDGRFEPHRIVTRAEMAKMVVDTSKTDIAGTDLAFDDVKKDDWFYPYVSAACNAKLFHGKSLNIFASYDGITRQEAAAVIYRMISDKVEPDSETGFVFDDDAEIADWAKEAVYFLKNNGFMQGRSDDEFSPQEFLTRAEAAVLISNVVKCFI